MILWKSHILSMSGRIAAFGEMKIWGNKLLFPLVAGKLGNVCPFQIDTPLLWKYSFWAIQRRFERLNISFSRLQRAPWRHIVRLWLITRKFLDGVGFFRNSNNPPFLEILQISTFFNRFHVSSPWESKLVLIFSWISLKFQKFAFHDFFRFRRISDPMY